MIGADEPSQDAALAVLAGGFEGKQVLQQHGVAFHSDDFGDVRHPPAAVGHPADMYDQVDGRGDLRPDCADRQIEAGHGEQALGGLEVLVENGGTVVIGGIFEQQDRTDTTRVPFFGSLPYVGWLFKNNTTTTQKAELLVFITPRIVNERLTVR